MLIRKSRAPIDGLTAASEVMLVSRDPSLCSVLFSRLTVHDGIHAVHIDSTQDALCRYAARPPGLVVLELARSEDLAALAQFRKLDRDVPIVALSADGSTVTVVQAMKLGAADVLSPPFHATDLDAALSHVLSRRRRAYDAQKLREDVRSRHKHTMLFGTGTAMAELHDLIDRVVDVDVPILIQGETGTGKELVARALAAPALQQGRPFVKVNCAALPGELFEAELFGFERGAFTGALQGKPGKFEIANGGTIFLDEIGELPLPLQSKLLQVLQDGHFSRLGGRGEIHPIVRVIAATNRDLRRAALEGRFRQDLLFRLNVIPMYVPPLRERQADIPLLAEFFSKRWAAFYNRPYVALSPEMMRECLHHRWPGNVRELENLMQRIVILGAATALSEAHAWKAVQRSSGALNPRVRRPTGYRGVESATRVAENGHDAAVGAEQRSLKHVSRRAARQAEASLIVRMLQQTRGDRRQAAINLGICYKALLYKIKEIDCEGGRRSTLDRCVAPPQPL
jgi:two-component system, NtrC family, response regulator AtoC